METDFSSQNKSLLPGPRTTCKVTLRGKPKDNKIAEKFQTFVWDYLSVYKTGYTSVTQRHVTSATYTIYWLFKRRMKEDYIAYICKHRIVQNYSSSPHFLIACFQKQGLFIIWLWVFWKKSSSTSLGSFYSLNSFALLLLLLSFVCYGT